MQQRSFVCRKITVEQTHMTTVKKRKKEKQQKYSICAVCSV